ncbi:MAG: hypothetical protein OEW75_03800 [Cyclobacteriaceae bacterium]|nr:hypothetical protein [Cyclobacteriaceae bacterium]
MNWIYFIFIFILVPIIPCYSQLEESFVVVEIEYKRKGSMHPIEIDYYILLINDWEVEVENPFVPLYLFGMSKGDFNECITTDTIQFFNYFDEITDDYCVENGLLNIIKQKRIKVQEINKFWNNKHKEEITVFLTPIIGSFKYCTGFHYLKGVTMFESVAMPLSGFSFDEKFWKSKVSKEIELFDFSKLDLVLLSKIQ